MNISSIARVVPVVASARHSGSLLWFALGLLCQGCPGMPLCGDSYMDPGEECDDGNTVDGDGCASACELEAGYACESSGGVCQAEYVPVCGDGIVTVSEQCDDGAHNADGYNQCTTNCTLGPYCGDGVLDAAYEECDDGSNTGADGCSPACILP